MLILRVFATMHKDYTLCTVQYKGNPPRQKTPHTCDPPAEGTPDPQLTEPPLTPKALLCIVVTRDSIWTHSSDQQYSFAIIKSSREKSATVVQQEHVRRKKYSNDLSSQLSPPILSPWELGAEGLSRKQLISNSLCHCLFSKSQKPNVVCLF